MIANQWYAVLESREIRRDPVGVLRMGEPLVFFRDRSGRVGCLADRCAHRGASLGAGELAGDNRTLVDGPVLRWLDPDRLRVFVYNRVDDGTTPRRPEDLDGPAEPEFHLDLILPNLWQNHISNQARIVVAFAPVDEEHTILYLRFYHGFLRLPVLGSLAARLAMPFNRRILHQDRSVVETQRPKRGELAGGEQLFQADHPIAAYRSRRNELIQAGSTAQDPRASR